VLPISNSQWVILHFITVDFLLVAFKCVLDVLAGDIPYLKYTFQSCGATGGDVEMDTHLNELILSAGCKKLAIRGETNGTDAEISLLGNVVVVGCAAEPSGAHIEYLGSALHPVGSHVPSLLKQTQHTTLLWFELVHKTNVERLCYT